MPLTQFLIEYAEAAEDLGEEVKRRQQAAKISRPHYKKHRR